MFKPVAFCVSKGSIPDVEFYSTNIKRKDISEGYNYNLTIWYLGDFPDKSNIIGFSFPQHLSLLDRNLIITIQKDCVQIENDWLGSIPVFYNKRKSIASTIPSLCLTDNSIDKEGLFNYAKFGYSVFEQTPFSAVKFLRYYSNITLDDQGINITRKADLISDLEVFNSHSEPEEVLQKIQAYINDVEEQTEGKILLPSSGGYDSRLLNCLVNDKSRIHGFTYGISSQQDKSYEVVFAKKLSHILNINWEQIELSNFNSYINDWHRLFGFSTHLHGMYHIEFYNKILSKHAFDYNDSFLSGIFGDVWAGNVNKQEINSSDDVRKLGYTHGMDLDDDMLTFNLKSSAMEAYFNENVDKLKSHQFQLISTIRMKIVLISYLVRVPEYFGIPVWTPFLNYDIAMSILRLPAEQREKRLWQKDFFKSRGLDIENLGLRYSKVNSLNNQGALSFDFEDINSKAVSDYFKPDKIEEINKHINNQNKLAEFFLTRLRLRSILRRLGIKKMGYLKTLSDYYVIKAIEKSILK